MQQTIPLNPKCRVQSGSYIWNCQLVQGDFLRGRKIDAAKSSTVSRLCAISSDMLNLKWAQFDVSTNVEISYPRNFVAQVHIFVPHKAKIHDVQFAVMSFILDSRCHSFLRSLTRELKPWIHIVNAKHTSINKIVVSTCSTFEIATWKQRTDM